MKKNNNYTLLAVIAFIIILFFIPNIVQYLQEPQLGLAWFFEYFKTPPPKEPVSVYINQKAKIRDYATEQTTEHIKEIPNHRKLFELYFQGVNEKYDANGNKVPGVEPNPDKAIFHIKKLIDSPEGTNNDVLRLAKIHHQGMHNLKPNIEEAEKVYSAILNNCGEMSIRNEAQDAIDEISQTRAREWLNLPLEVPPRINIQQQPPGHVAVPEFTNDFGMDVFHILDDNEFNINHILMITAQLDELDQIDPPNIGAKEYNDPQNVHDPMIISTMKNSVERIKNKMELPETVGTPVGANYNNIYNDILQHINNKTQTSKTQDALKSLNRINNSNQIFTHGDINMSEQEALQMVWNRIKDPIFDDNRDNVKDILIEELASMQEYDQTICPTGRFVRIVDTLNVVDPEVSIKPKYAINEEMMSKSAKIRENLLENKTDRHLLERGESPQQDEFDSLLKETIITELEKDYVHSKILTPSQFTTEINKWIEHI